MKPSAGLKLPLNRVMKKLKTSLEYFITMVKVEDRTIMKPFAGLKLPLNRVMKKLNLILVYVIQMEKE